MKKVFIQYGILFSIIFFITSIALYWNHESNIWIPANDKLFTYVISIAYIVAISLLDYKKSNYYILRHPDIKALYMQRWTENIYIAFLLTGLYITCNTLTGIIACGIQLYWLPDIIDLFIRVCLGCSLLGSLSLILQNSIFYRIRFHSYLITFLVLLTELMLLPNLCNSFNFNINLLFGWIYESKKLLAYSILVIYNMGGLVYGLFIASRRDILC